jgi:two-component system C4-dicarboxylate transport sensor histidine kinase DctB
MAGRATAHLLLSQEEVLAMMSIRWRQLISFIGGVAAIGVSTFVSQHVWREGGIRSLQAVNEQRVQLVANALTAEVGRQDHLPVVLSLDADVRSALAAPDAERIARLDRKLTIVSHEADTRALYVIAPNGTVLASDDWDSPQTLVGRNLAERPYFVKAAASGKSSYLGVEPDSDRVRYYLAEAVRDGSRLLGIAVVRIEFDALEAAWERAAERVLITDSEGIVFLASDPAYKYRQMGPTSAVVGADVDVARRYPGVLASPIDLVVRERRGLDSIVQVRAADNELTYLYQSMQLPAYGWTIHRLTDLASAREDQRDGAIIGGATSALIISLLLYVMQRHRAYVSQREAAGRLKGEVAERTRELSASNASLQTEIDQHRRTESRLRTTQNELVQAGKLAALGQMSAAIAHEINQPLAAIRTFMASAKVFAQRGNVAQMLSNLDLITDLAERMASITGHLKTFARKSEPGHPEPVLVDRAVEGTLFLLESQIKAAGIRIEKKVAPELWVLGHAVQLEQVILNLVRNALDAVADQVDGWIQITARASDDTVSIVVSDNGPGISHDQISKIFDPFFTTKSVGKGLGLGLSISYGIVQDFGGEIQARNRAEGGAEMTVELPRHKRDTVAVEKAVHA